MNICDAEDENAYYHTTTHATTSRVTLLGGIPTPTQLVQYTINKVNTVLRNVASMWPILVGLCNSIQPI